jgi:hypothetical protein
MIDKNKLLVVGIVVLLGYYLYDRNRKMRLVSDLKAGADTDFVQEVVVDKVNETDCQKEWVQKIGSTTKFRSAEARKKSQTDYVASCLKNK